VNPSLTITALAEHTIAQLPTINPPDSGAHHGPAFDTGAKLTSTGSAVIN
jgi:hypothetical protein